jgi:dipeptidyl aminopeptidase/acylaminoacyl peptidase
VVNQGPIASLAILEVEERTLSTYQIEPGVYHRPRFTPDGENILFIFDNYQHPDDLWSFSIADNSFKQLTNSLPLELQGSSFTMPTPIDYPSLDGQPVPALLYQPNQIEGLPPAVIDIHGGPNWSYQAAWDPLIQHMVSRGWVVLAPNYRGSTGYGRAWQLANRFDLGGGDTEDVVAGADYLKRENLADVERIAVTGRSYGGYLTMTSLTQYPDLWAGGSAVVPFLNWFTAHANSREDLQHWDIENFGDPEENHDLWRLRSPFYFLDSIKAPVQMICGAHDPRCPASESISAQDVLSGLDKQVDFALYPDEGHSFLKTENVVSAELRRMSFLSQILE